MLQTQLEASKRLETERKNIVTEYFRLVSLGQFKEGLRFFAADCKTHNPYVAGSMSDLTNAMLAANEQGRAQYPETEFSVKHVLADGDFVAAHTQLLSSKSDPSQGGLRQVHLFRFEGKTIVEYWDITQQVTLGLPNAGGAF